MKKFLLSFIFLFSIGSILAQKDVILEIQENRLDSLVESVLFDDFYSDLFAEDYSTQFLYWRANYDAKTFYAGREIGIDQYNLSSQLFYLHTKGFYAGVSGAWYSDLDPNYRTTVLTLGYGKGLKKIKFLRYRASYDLFFYNNQDPDYEPIYTSSLNVGTTLKSKIVSTRFDASFLLGKEFGTQLSWDIYSKINLLKFGRLNKLRIEPEVSFTYGSETVEYDLSAYLLDQYPDLTDTYYYEDVFGMLNTSIEVPLNLSLKNFDIEFSWKKNFPHSMDYTIEYPNTSFFSFSIGYLFNL
ncbi:hypothetical protein ACUNWD_07965 [Sunxiuqinia sp. A32]|uniref:hypothetical protein n=1 Tax=Sunxiuqinia sp. A32 TaxID=3461496 RepID=UPI00404548E0